jgi:hypothetical protein
MLEVQVITLGRISFSVTINLSSTPYKSYNTPLHRLHTPMANSLVGTPSGNPSET